jgi:hypothetical protein
MERRQYASPGSGNNYSTNRARSVSSTLAFRSASVGFVLVSVMPLLFLFWLMQPTIIPNPGMNAHNAPSATRVEPSPRKMELLGFEEPSDPGLLSRVARNYARPHLPPDYAEHEDIEKPTKRQVRVSGRKRFRLARGRKDNERSYAYVPDWSGNRRQSVR